MCRLAFLDGDSIEELGGHVLYQGGLVGVWECENYKQYIYIVYIQPKSRNQSCYTK